MMDLNHEITMFVLIALLASAIGLLNNISKNNINNRNKDTSNLKFLLWAERLYISAHVLLFVVTLTFAAVTSNYNVLKFFLISVLLIFVITSLIGVVIAFFAYLYLLASPNDYNAQRILLIAILCFLPGIKYFPMGCIIVYVVFYFSSLLR